MTSPAELRYTKEHEWARLEDDGTLTVGITDHAQDALGDVVFVELPTVGDTVDVDGKFGVVESVKTVSDLFSPCAGVIEAVNESLDAEPELVNSAPYSGGWMVKIRIEDSAQYESLMDSESYDAFVASEG